MLLEDRTEADDVLKGMRCLKVYPFICFFLAVTSWGLLDLVLLRVMYTFP